MTNYEINEEAFCHLMKTQSFAEKVIDSVKEISSVGK
jgi:hypothetical protein